MTHVFVYGTLMRGRGNNGLFHGNDYCLGSARTVNEYTMRQGGIPFVARAEGNTYPAPIRGELWYTEHLSHLDRLEGHPNFYRRDKVVVEIDGGNKQVEAWLYFNETTHAQLSPMNKEGEYEYA